MLSEAASRVFTTLELMEEILLELSINELVLAVTSCLVVRDTISASGPLRDRLLTAHQTTRYCKVPYGTFFHYRLRENGCHVLILRRIADTQSYAEILVPDDPGLLVGLLDQTWTSADIDRGGAIFMEKGYWKEVDSHMEYGISWHKRKGRAEGSVNYDRSLFVYLLNHRTSEEVHPMRESS